MLLSALFFTTPLLALALPTNSQLAAPSSVNITLYTGTSNSGQNVNCGYGIGHSVWSAGVCNNIVTQGLGIPLSNVTSSCVFQLYSSTTNCNGTAATNVQTIHLPQGSGEQCIATGVEDGGNHYHGSGIWKC